MDRYQYKGHPEHLAAACTALGVDPGAVHTRARALLGSLDSLAGSAADAEPEHMRGILDAAATIRDSLAVVHQTAESVLAEVAAALGLPELDPKVVPASATAWLAAALEASERRAADLEAQLAETRPAEGPKADAAKKPK